LSPLATSGLAFACILGGALLGMLVGRTLPAHHTSGDSKDAVKLGLGLIATLTALVLGLLVASAKGTYDRQSGAVKELVAKVILLDRTLAMYGPETKEARELLRRAGDRTLSHIWPDDSARPADLAPDTARAEMALFYDKVAALSPDKDDAKRATLKARALDATADLGQTRLRLFAEREGSVPAPFLAVLVVWLVVLFAGYGLIAPRNATVVAVQVACILSVAAALFLILELDRPFDGLLGVPSAPARDALSRVGE
jgi:hypothetical protein